MMHRLEKEDQLKGTSMIVSADIDKSALTLLLIRPYISGGHDSSAGRDNGEN